MKKLLLISMVSALALVTSSAFAGSTGFSRMGIDTTGGSWEYISADDDAYHKSTDDHTTTRMAWCVFPHSDVDGVYGRIARADSTAEYYSMEQFHSCFTGQISCHNRGEDGDWHLWNIGVDSTGTYTTSNASTCGSVDAPCRAYYGRETGYYNGRDITTGAARADFFLFKYKYTSSGSTYYQKMVSACVVVE